MTVLSGKVVVVTGANQGIGKAIARLFGEQGARLALCARNPEKLSRVVEELQILGIESFGIPCDVSQEDQVQSFFREVMARFGRVDILVNNAGAFDGGRIDQLEKSAWDNVIGACLTGTFLCSRAVFPSMIQQKGGRILNIGSISAQRPREGNTPYAAAKFGVWGLTQAIALDGRPFGIACSCLHPGNVLVERRAGDVNQEPMMSVETIAQAALAMVSLPPEVNFLEGIILPVGQEYLGRG